MTKHFTQLTRGVYRIADSTVVALAWLASYWLRFYHSPIDAPKGLPSFSSYAALVPIVLVTWIATFAVASVYESRRMLRFRDEAAIVLRAHGLGLLGFVAITYMTEGSHYSRVAMAYFAVLSTVALLGYRYLLKSGLRAIRRRGLNLRHVLVIGDGPLATSLIGRLDALPDLGLRVKGVIAHPQFQQPCLACKPVVGTYTTMDEVLDAGGIDEVLVALPHEHREHLDPILARLADEAPSVRLVPDVSAYATLGCEVEVFEGVPMLRINDAPLTSSAAIAKRATDIVFSAMGLIAISPLLALIAAAVRLTSPGPVLFSQERMGLDGRTFRMLKFRSMRVDAEKDSGAVWARKDDHRRTAVGTFLRRTSLDELPQLWNVLKGEMSLVGPRPERPVFVRKFRKEIPHYMLRHKVKAGITGWAQVNGWRGNTSLNRRTECDLYYIQNWTYAFDLKILTMTLWKGFVHKNAY